MGYDAIPKTLLQSSTKHDDVLMMPVMMAAMMAVMMVVAVMLCRGVHGGDVADSSHVCCTWEIMN